MGTSGSYGGTNRADWNRARNLLDDLINLPSESSISSPGEVSNAPIDEIVSDIWGAVSDALHGEDPSWNQPETWDGFDLENLLPRVRPVRQLGTSLGTGVPSAPIQGQTSSKGRRGSRSTRSIVKGASRGAIAIAGGYALRNSDSDTLSQIGLNLAELQAKGPRAQWVTILDELLGEPGHPDEFALREAVSEVLKQIILGDVAPELEISLKAFFGNYIYKLVIIELSERLRNDQISPEESETRERMMKRWATSRVSAIQLNLSETLSVRDLVVQTNRLAKEAIRILKAGLDGEI